MEHEINLQIVLLKPARGVDYALQRGRGHSYETVQTQRGMDEDLHFEFTVRVNEGRTGEPNFLGPFTQGSAGDRFVYLDIGTLAGQKDSCWSRRLKIPLVGIGWDSVLAATRALKPLQARVVGRGGGDGSPACGTVKDFSGWKLKK